MGLEDRQYYQDQDYTYTGSYGRGGGGGGGFSFGPGKVTDGIIFSLILVNVAVFFLDAFTARGPGQMHWLGQNFAFDTNAPWKVWTWLTHGFTHSALDSETGIMHIASNMLTLFFLGRPVEQKLGKNEFLRFYIVSIIVAITGLYLYCLITGEQSLCVGASGAVSATVMLFIFMYPKATILLFFVIPMRAWILGVFIIGMDVMRAFEPDSHVAWQAHLAGAAFGATYLLMGWNLSFLGNWLGGEDSPGGYGGSTNPGGGGIAGLFKKRPSLKIHDPEARMAKLKSQADEVLEKINQSGEQSLTRRERKILSLYSEEIRKNRDS